MSTTPQIIRSRHSTSGLCLYWSRAGWTTYVREATPVSNASRELASADADVIGRTTAQGELIFEAAELVDLREEISRTRS